MKRNPWTEEELNFLINNYSKMRTKEIAKLLGKDYTATKRKARKYIIEPNKKFLPEGYIVIPSSKDHAINENGRVISIKTRREIKAHPDGKGYLTICLQNKKSHRVHKLVALLFLTPSNNIELNQINHIDGNKNNNHVSNLEWTTHKDNIAHSWKIGLRKNVSNLISIKQTGETNSSAKLKEKEVLEIYEMLLSNVRNFEIAKKYKVTHSTICDIKSGKSWKHLHHHFLKGSSASA